MKHSVQPCDETRLRALLSYQGDSPDIRAATEHVEQCPRCQARLTELAAKAGQWQETRELLSASAADAALEAERRERASSGA